MLMIYVSKKQPSPISNVQVGTIGTIPSGEDFEVMNTAQDRNFQFYVFATEATTATIVPYDMTESVEFPLEQGWNPIKIKRVVNAPDGLFFGF